MPYGDTTWTDK